MTDESSLDAQPLKLEMPIEQMRSVPISMHFISVAEKTTAADIRRQIEESKPPRGSAFFYRLDGKTYLVTARHCFSAKHWETGEYLPGSYSVEPTHIRLMVRKEPPGGKWDARKPAEIVDTVIPLLDEEMKPLWFEHPYHRGDMDVAVLPLPDALANNSDLLIEPYAPAPSGADDAITRLLVTQDVFVVGYPYGLESGFLLPLWTRGTVASEPALYYTHRGRDLPLLLIDARTREGQSGSPVIVYRKPLTPIYTNSGEVRFTVGGQSQILGVYSGRTSPESDLGFVWRIEEVDTICREGVTPADI